MVKATASGRPVARVALAILTYALRAVWISTMVLTPLFGFWLASSLAAYHNASQWLALLVGLLLFPLCPVGWDLLYVWRRRRADAGSKLPPRKQILTRIDRLVLRTLAINGVFLVGMMYFAHQTAFRALAVRGDWILDGHHGPVASSVRRFLLGFADRFEQRWHVADGRYGTSDEAPTPSELPPKDATTGWPLPAEPDVQVTDMPESAQGSIDSVGQYLATRFADKRRLVKAIHDYVALRLTYDKATLALYEQKRYAEAPKQEAEVVFASRTAVCAGYARLVVAIGKAAGLEVAYVTGYARDAEQLSVSGTDATALASLEGGLHAWNAVKIDGTWMLLDVTWDDNDPGEPIESEFLLTPPAWFGYQHLPEDPAWQLVAAPLSPGEFIRQPLLRPHAGELGLVLEEPQRSQVSADGEIDIRFGNPYNAAVSAYARRAGAPETTEHERCDVATDAGKTVVHCALADGEYEVRMFGGPPAARSLQYIGSLLVNSR